MAPETVLKFLVLAAIVIWAAVFLIPDGKLHVVFCDVGQGDAILITHRTNQLLIDGGPGKRVLGCLERHIPFFDRRIEAIVLTHQNSDHSQGLAYVRERYSTLQFESYLHQDQEIKIGEIDFRILWPKNKALGEDKMGSENDQGIVGKVSYGQFDVLLTADAPTGNYENPGGRIEVVKVPHHGSATDWDPLWWKKVKPALAVISVGKNTFGHPAEEIIKTLRLLDIKILRTDQEGDIEIVSDGKSWEVK